MSYTIPYKPNKISLLFMLRPIVFIILILILNNSYSDSTVETKTNPDYIDEQYNVISHTVIKWFDSIDKNFTNWVFDLTTDENTKEKHAVNQDQVGEDSIDSFFQNEKFLEESDDAYILLRVSSFFASREGEKFKPKARAQIPLRQTRKRLKLFVEDFNRDNAKDILTDNDQIQETAPKIGIHLFSSKSQSITSKYSLGIRGVYPFARARYSKEIPVNEWLIEPVQSFVYSTKDKFEEKTDIYFDRQLIDKSLFRIQLHRQTKSKTDGMDYSLGFSYHKFLKDKVGLRFSQLFWGNTEYTYTLNKATDPVTKSEPYSGISNYVTSISWRQNIWKKWFFFEVQPSVSFHKQYDYKPNYSLNIDLEFYFGKYSGR